MADFFGLRKHDPDAAGVAVSPETAAELRRIANLFLVSAITLALVVLRALAESLDVTIIPRPVYVAWGAAMLVGIAITYVYGIYVTLTARRWGWLALCVVPFSCVPAAAAYAWIRRQEIERAVLGDDRATASGRQRRGGRRR